MNVVEQNGNTRIIITDTGISVEECAGDQRVQTNWIEILSTTKEDVLHDWLPDVTQCQIIDCRNTGNLTDVGVTCIDQESEDGLFMYEGLEAYLCHVHDDTH